MSIVTTRLRKSFGTPPTEVIKGLDLTIEDGEFAAILGRSGCGKSTLLYLLSTLDQATSGSLRVDGKEISALTQAELHRFRNQSMGFIFQFHYLLPELTALENVLMPAMKTKTHLAKTSFAKELLERFGLADKLDRLSTQLSGGEQQRVAIARALIMRPRYLFADEPTGNLDSANGDVVMNILSTINRDDKTTIIMVTHDPDYAAMATRKVHMADGLIVT
jgi:ABC-type lipoprotein export system ATPase subunit